MNILEQGILASVGLASLTVEKAKQITDDLIKEGNLRKDEGVQFAEKLVKQGEEERTALRKLFQDEIESTMQSMNLVTKKDLKDLEKKIDALKKE
jgi:polyhydroxyalkanoate synthesis regulator phasin